MVEARRCYIQIENWQETALKIASEGGGASEPKQGVCLLARSLKLTGRAASAPVSCRDQQSGGQQSGQQHGRGLLRAGGAGNRGGGRG